MRIFIVHKGRCATCPRDSFLFGTFYCVQTTRSVNATYEPRCIVSYNHGWSGFAMVQSCELSIISDQMGLTRFGPAHYRSARSDIRSQRPRLSVRVVVREIHKIESDTTKFHRKKIKNKSPRRERSHPFPDRFHTLRDPPIPRKRCVAKP